MPKYVLEQALRDYVDEQREREMEAQSIYSALGAYFKWKAEAIYEDAIISLVGEVGLSLLREFNLIESCGIIEGKKLYAI